VETPEIQGEGSGKGQCHVMFVSKLRLEDIAA
jgi:hypothetical protein